MEVGVRVYTINELIERHGWPQCTKCGKPVDRVFTCETHSLTGDVEIGVACHGKIETITISPERLHMPDHSWRFGEAFTDGKQLNPPPRAAFTSGESE